MRILTTLLALTVFFTLIPAIAQANCDPGETKIKFSHVTNADRHPKGIAASLLQKRVNAEMQGKLCMEVFPNSQLYNDNQVLEALLNGDVQMAAPSLSKFEKFTKKFRIFDLPFLFQDVTAIDRFQNSPDGKRLKRAMLHRGLIGLAFWHNGMKQLSANRPLLKPEDAAGLKFRIQSSDVLQAQFEALKANPQKMAFSEVYGALQTGVVDGQENTWSNIYGKKFFEVQDGITETNHGILDYMVVTSVDFWEGLPDNNQKQLSQILREVTKLRNQKAIAVNAENRRLILEAGGTIRKLTPSERQRWAKTMRPVWAKFAKDVGVNMISIANSYNALN